MICHDILFCCSQVSTNFVCWRGLLTKILCTPYENQEGWKIAAARFRNCIYLCEYDTQQKVEDKRFEEPRQKEMTYWGLKFEQYVTTGEREVVIICTNLNLCINISPSHMIHDLALRFSCYDNIYCILRLSIMYLFWIKQVIEEKFWDK